MSPTEAGWDAREAEWDRQRVKLREAIAQMSDDELAAAADRDDYPDMTGHIIRSALVARHEQRATTAKRAPLDQRNAAIIEALHQPGALARTVAPNFAASRRPPGG